MSTQQSATQIPAHRVKELRERTGAGFSDCRAALVEAAGDGQKAINILRKKGQAAAGEKKQRAATQGAGGHFNHTRRTKDVVRDSKFQAASPARTRCVT